MPPQILADRFVASDSSWIDLASGAPVRLRVEPAGSPAEQIEWNRWCGVLANLRHPLVNPLLDYGMADARRTFEAYTVDGPIPVAGHSAAALLDHAVRFLTANGVELPRPLADYVLRGVTAGHGRRVQPVGISLQRRPVFEAIREALDTAQPVGTCAVSIAGEPQSGLRTLRMAAARTARLEGYVPVAASVLARHAWLASRLLERHVCVIAGEHEAERHVVAGILARLGSVSARRHLLLSFSRTRPALPSLQVDRMGIVALTGMVFVDREDGPSPEQLFSAARDSGGRPGQFLARLGAYEPAGRTHATLSVHETAQPYIVAEPHTPPAASRTERCGKGVLHRAAARGEALARAGRHAGAERLLRRATRVLSARGEPLAGAACALRLGWMLLQRAQLSRAIESFANAKVLAVDAATSIAAGIGTGVAWTDEGRLSDAEAVLRGAAIAAQKVQDARLHAQAAAALGRCLFWQGRYDEAAAVLRAPAGAQGTETGTSRTALTLARVHIAEGAIGAAVRMARRAVDCATELDDPGEIAPAYRVLAQAVAASGDGHGAATHLAAGLQAATRAHLPLEAVRLRLAGLEIQASVASSPENRRAAERLVAASVRWPPLLRFHARVVLSRLDGTEPDAATRAFIETSGAVALAEFRVGPRPNPVADLEALLAIGQTATDDRTALERVSEHLRVRLRAATVVVIGPEPERRVLAQAGRVWQGEALAAWRSLATGLGVGPDPLVEPCQAAEPLRYGGEVIGSIAARWIAGSPLDPVRESALLRVGALAVAANVRAVLDRSLPPQTGHPADEILGESAPARSMREAIARAARAPFPILIEGESGSGKELVARAIHRLGPRRDRRFCALNCAALSDDLLEAELFGHARGAFTGAVSERAGLFEEADGGTLFLDEIGELSPRAQAKLLRVLQDGQVRRVGENVSRRVDVRIVAATNRRLAQEVIAGRFRADLRFRLDVVRIDVPPLRERAGDVPLLAASFWNEAAARMGSRATLSPDAMAALARYDWPGNVRELQNVIAWMAVHSPSRGRITAAAVPGHVACAAIPAAATFESARAEFERRFVKAALGAAGGHRARAAEALGVTRQGFAKMLRRLELE